MCAVKLYKELGIKSMNDKELLKEAKNEAYLKGFYKGIMSIGNFKGEKVENAKNLIKKQLIDNNEAIIYFEPENKVISRLGEECVVALCDQWYIDYGTPKV